MPVSYLVGVDAVTLALWLSEAQIARHKLATGTKEASVSYEGKSVTFTQSDLFRLDVYIGDLLKAIAELSGVVTRKGPVYVAF